MAKEIGAFSYRITGDDTELRAVLNKIEARAKEIEIGAGGAGGARGARRDSGGSGGGASTVAAGADIAEAGASAKAMNADIAEATASKKVTESMAGLESGSKDLATIMLSQIHGTEAVVSALREIQATIVLTTKKINAVVSQVTIDDTLDRLQGKLDGFEDGIEKARAQLEKLKTPQFAREEDQETAKKIQESAIKEFQSQINNTTSRMVLLEKELEDSTSTMVKLGDESKGLGRTFAKTDNAIDKMVNSAYDHVMGSDKVEKAQDDLTRTVKKASSELEDLAKASMEAAEANEQEAKASTQAAKSEEKKGGIAGLMESPGFMKLAGAAAAVTVINDIADKFVDFNRKLADANIVAQLDAIENEFLGLGTTSAGLAEKTMRVNEAWEDFVKDIPVVGQAVGGILAAFMQSNERREFLGTMAELGKASNSAARSTADYNAEAREQIHLLEKASVSTSEFSRRKKIIAAEQNAQVNRAYTDMNKETDKLNLVLEAHKKGLATDEQATQARREHERVNELISERADLARRVYKLKVNALFKEKQEMLELIEQDKRRLGLSKQIMVARKTGDEEALVALEAQQKLMLGMDALKKKKEDALKLMGNQDVIEERYQKEVKLLKETIKLESQNKLSAMQQREAAAKMSIFYEIIIAKMEKQQQLARNDKVAAMMQKRIDLMKNHIKFRDRIKNAESAGEKRQLRNLKKITDEMIKQRQLRDLKATQGMGYEFARELDALKKIDINIDKMIPKEGDLVIGKKRGVFERGQFDEALQKVTEMIRIINMKTGSIFDIFTGEKMEPQEALDRLTKQISFLDKIERNTRQMNAKYI